MSDDTTKWRLEKWGHDRALRAREEAERTGDYSRVLVAVVANSLVVLAVVVWLILAMAHTA
jgi:hypothetical protein